MTDATDAYIDAIAAAPESAETYLACAEQLRSLDDPRGEFITVQLELETARGSRARHSG